MEPLVNASEYCSDRNADMLELGSSSQIESELLCEQVFPLNLRGIKRLWELACLAPKPL